MSRDHKHQRLGDSAHPTPDLMEKVLTVDNVVLIKRGHHISGSLVLSKYHMVFTFRPTKADERPRQIWICYPIIEKMTKSRGRLWPTSAAEGSAEEPSFDSYSASNIRLFCKDFSYFAFDFSHDYVCSDVFNKLSELIMTPKLKNNIAEFYAYDYKPNALEAGLPSSGWKLYDAVAEYERQTLLGPTLAWRLSHINKSYKLCPSYPDKLVVPDSVSESVVQHASKFRSKQRIPAVVYKHRHGPNGNVIARCLQPLVGLNLQNRSLQDEKLVGSIFETQKTERLKALGELELVDQPQRNLIVDLRPITNAMAQHALGAGTEIIENYRGSGDQDENEHGARRHGFQQVDKIFCNIDNIHVMRDSLNRLTQILSDLDQKPVGAVPNLQQALIKTQWLHRLSIILQLVDRISKSVHLNNTNVLIHCSDGWDRTSQVSALSQLCLDPYYRTTRGFMVLVEKEWLSFGFKFATRADHSGCIGAYLPQAPPDKSDAGSKDAEILLSYFDVSSALSQTSQAKSAVSSFILRAANQIKVHATGGSSASNLEASIESSASSVYGGSNERSPIFHQFLDCVYQIFRQHPTKFEFNSRFLKRLFYHSYSCQYGTFLCNTEKGQKADTTVADDTVSVWDYFLSRPNEFANPAYDASTDTLPIFVNYSEVKWWYELYGRSDEEMNGLSNSLDRKFAKLKLNREDPLSSDRVLNDGSTTALEEKVTSDA